MRCRFLGFLGVALVLLGGCGKKLGLPPVPWRPQKAVQALRPAASQPVQVAEAERGKPSEAEPQAPDAQPQEESQPEPEPMPEPEPLPEIPADVRGHLEALGARINVKPSGYAIDIRHKPGFTDREIDAVIQCPQVVDLTLENVAITDQGLEKLKAFPQLERLILNNCPISAAGLKTLSELPLRETLISIGLKATNVKDDDVLLLADFPRLERLDVSQTAVTDASLPAIEKLPLEMLNAAQTQMTAAALDQLQQQKPTLVVKR